MHPSHKLIWIPRLVILAALTAVILWTFNSSPRVLAQPEIASGPDSASGWRVGEPVSYETLTVFPVLSSQEAYTADFETLDAALASGEAIVAEQGDYMRRSRNGVETTPTISSGPQVNQLVLVNRGKKPLLLLAGEVVSGGKQDRIIGKDRIIPVGAKPLPLDVFCVEHSRWTGGGDTFSAAKTMVHPTVREQAAVDQDQSKVWAAVRGDTAAARAQSSMSSSVEVTAPQISSQQLSRVMASAAPTEGYRNIYQSAAVGPSVENFALEVERRFNRATSGLKGEHVVGVIVAFGGEVAWSDIFASSQLFDAYWSKLLRSYAVEALTRPGAHEKVSFEDARDFLRPTSGHVREETEPGVYRWQERSQGRETEIQLEALEPKPPLTLHWLKVLRTS
jgi:ARG/rhodanese/phosphatase superfamily protein